MIEIFRFYGPACPEVEDEVFKALEIYEGRAVVKNIDAYKEIDLVDKYNICRVPTYIILEDDKEVKRVYDCKMLIT